MPRWNTSSEATRRARAACNSSSGRRETACSSRYENSRPIAAPICATRRTDARRSSRAISESCSVVGIPTSDTAQFLDKQRHAVGAINDLSEDLVGQASAAGDLRYQSSPIAPIQAIERQHADLRLAGPGRLELGAERDDEQHWQAADMFDGEVEQLARRRVDPMRVLENYEHRLLACQPFELPG